MIFKHINDWANERGLLDIEFNKAKQASFLVEEISELLRAKDEYEEIDALADIIVFSNNILQLLKFDTTIFNSKDILGVQYSDDGIKNLPTLCDKGKFLLGVVCTFLIDKTNTFTTEDDILEGLIKHCIFMMKAMGYNPRIVMQETLKEISSRVGAYSEETGKWEKDKSPEAQANWYKADYSLAKES